MSLTSGQKLGSYEIRSALGAGGMGEVYRARDSRLGRDVALKILPPEVTNEPGRLERFDREARAIAALNHPHIVTIYSTEEADGIRFLAMELVDGCTLGDLIMPSGMAMPKFLEIALPLADALAAAHQKQITHRDLKPGNVMVSNDGRVKVLDFGLARMGGADAGEQALIATQVPITHQGMIVGTMPYMSPEQVEGRLLDPRSDLFSLGVIFYELLSGSRPFSGSSSPALMSAILRDTPSSVRDQRPDLPEALDRLVNRLLEKRPEDRVQTARDVFNELRSIRKDAESGVRSRPQPDAASIAVMPFSDLSPAKDQDWFCDGIAEEILNALAPLPGLRVAARASAFSFRGKSDDLRSIGEKLNVTTVLEGSVRRAGDRVRIMAQLSDAQQGRQLWSERFDRELKDIFDVQEEIARAIVERLRITLTDGERLVPKRTASIDAYELLLKGRELLTRRGPALASAIGCFEQAVALDPDLSAAHAGIGDAYRLMVLYGFMAPEDATPRARASLEQALALEPNQPDALASLANISHASDWDFESGREWTERALAVERNHVRALAESAIMMATAAAQPPSPPLVTLILERITRARIVDPLNAWTMAVEAMVLVLVGQRVEALAAARRAVSADPHNFTANWACVLTLAGLDRHDEAHRAAAVAFAIFGRHPSLLAELAASHAALGETHEANGIFEEIAERAASGYVGIGVQAAIAASAGRFDVARTLLPTAIARRDTFLTFVNMLGAWRPSLADPACATLLRDMPYVKNALK